MFEVRKPEIHLSKALCHPEQLWQRKPDFLIQRKVEQGLYSLGMKQTKVQFHIKQNWPFGLGIGDTSGQQGEKGGKARCDGSHVWDHR